MRKLELNDHIEIVRVIYFPFFVLCLFYHNAWVVYNYEDFLGQGFNITFFFGRASEVEENFAENFVLNFIFTKRLYVCDKEKVLNHFSIADISLNMMIGTAVHVIWWTLTMIVKVYMAQKSVIVSSTELFWKLILNFNLSIVKVSPWSKFSFSIPNVSQIVVLRRYYFINF